MYMHIFPYTYVYVFDGCEHLLVPKNFQTHVLHDKKTISTICICKYVYIYTYTYVYMYLLQSPMLC